MSNGLSRAPAPVNEPVRGYAPGSPERASIKAELARQSGGEVEATPIIGGEAVTTGDTSPMVMPHDHQHQLGVFHKAGAKQVATVFDEQSDLLVDWAADDAWGVSIDYDLTADLAGAFAEMATSQPQ